MAKQVKGVGKPSKAKIAADKQKRQAEHLKEAKQRAYDRAYKMRAIQLEKAKGQADATRDAGVEPRQQQPLTKAPKASGRKPFKPAKPATKASGKNARGKK